MPAVDVEGYLRLIRGESRGLGALVARAGLRAATYPYGFVVGLRNLGYDLGWLQAVRASVPVVSIGNITMGGTGKTPMVEWVARWFRRQGVRVVLLSRGYKGGEGLNDEGLVLDANLADVPHLQAGDRVKLARIAVEELEAEVLVLDDGFQHRRLGRDLDMVLLDALDPFGLGALAPRGLLREPLESLRRARVIVLTRADLVDAEARARVRARVMEHCGVKPWVETRHAPHSVVNAHGTSEPVASLAGCRVAAFCGIGNPLGFRKTLERMGTDVRAMREYSDHHAYTKSDVAELRCWAAAADVDLALTTQKDLVKLQIEDLGGVPLRALRIGLEVLEGAEVLDQALRGLGVCGAAL